MALRHRLRDEVTAHLASHAGGDGGAEKEPNVGPFARAGPFHSERHFLGPTRVGQGCDIIAPTSFVKIHGKKRAGFVLQHRVNADHMTSPEVIVNSPLGNRDESLVRALTTLHARLLAYTTHPLVGASRRIALRTLLGVDPALWVNVGSTNGFANTFTMVPFIFFFVILLGT